MPCGSVKTMPFVCKPGISTIKMSHPAGCFLNKSPQIVVARIIVPHNFTERYHHHHYILRRSEKKGNRFAISRTVKHAKTKLKETEESNRFHLIYQLIAEASNKLKAQTERHLAWPRRQTGKGKGHGGRGEKKRGGDAKTMGSQTAQMIRRRGRGVPC